MLFFDEQHSARVPLRIDRFVERAGIDLVRVDGVPLARVRDALVTLERTGVGYFPNSVFVHVDVRDERHAWVDFGTGSTRATPDSAPPAPTWEDLDALRRETEAALAGIDVPAP